MPKEAKKLSVSGEGLSRGPSATVYAQTPKGIVTKLPSSDKKIWPDRKPYNNHRRDAVRGCMCFNVVTVLRDRNLSQVSQVNVSLASQLRIDARLAVKYQSAAYPFVRALLQSESVPGIKCLPCCPCWPIK